MPLPFPVLLLILFLAKGNDYDNDHDNDYDTEHDNDDDNDELKHLKRE